MKQEEASISPRVHANLGIHHRRGRAGRLWRCGAGRSAGSRSHGSTGGRSSRLTARAPSAPAAYSEAPMLAELVAAGTLPPVDERLPENPMVMAVAESIGNYGGTFRRGFKGVSDRWGPTKHVDRLLVWCDKDLIQRPRMVES